MSKLMKVIAIVVILFTVMMTVNNCYAQINEKYAAQSGVVETDLSKKLSSSLLIDAIAQMIYGIGSFMEYILGMVFGMITGTNTFPWADQIVFNAVPLLDINFMNPASNSFIGTMQSIIQKLYGTILSLGVTFFSIAVLVMAIKLATTTIASEKAQYKKAVWDWAVGLVMLFGIHFVISFIFYLNEMLVESASNIVIDKLKDDPFVMAVDQSAALTNFLDPNKSFALSLGQVFNIVAWIDEVGAEIDQYFNGNVKEVYKEVANFKGKEALVAGYLVSNRTWSEYAFGWNVGDTPQKPMNNVGDWFHAALDAVKEFTYGALSGGYPGPAEVYILYNSTKAMQNETFVTDLKEALKDSGNQKARDVVYKAFQGEYGGKTNMPIDITALGNSIWNNARSPRDAANTMIDAAKIAGGQTDGLVTQLARYFKVNAWTTAKGGWKADKPSIQNALLYAILVVQSVIFFVAYMKRLFYVIILALMAPIVVVYDFMQKATKT